MCFFSEQKKYLKHGRLSDVLRLITVLSLNSEHKFRKEKGLLVALNGSPFSGKDWFDVAKDHPEFFRINQSEESLVLLFRLSNRKEPGTDNYIPLTIDQTQKLIDQAILLHDKEIARLQKNSFLIPLYIVVITSITTLITLFIKY